ncbi:30S ribosomal protein S9 [Campylobacter troglodytis]|uniref:30S ribosomal protein S9 n=1 Tax=Campylobacter troglodytis TaxID=654363 RepID=UPI001157F07F|nr:30S ribosomal protein S9 [Campylobacter troglodytis]TQR54468.1 30S ribosomal protein S9 [Campylobacter troglodytis]
MAKSTSTYATGKRKTAVAKVWLSTGKGEIIVNGMDLNTWLGGHEAIKLKVVQPLLATKQEKSMSIKATTLGGGYNAQAEALRHGISKALALMDTEFRALLKPQGLLTRDSRTVERKKYGKRKARRSPQFSKR